MTDPAKDIAAWNQAAVEAAMTYARTSLATAEQLLKLNLEAARTALEQNSKAARELLATDDPEKLMALRGKLAHTSVQQAATYASSVYEVVAGTQAQLAQMFEQSVARVSQDIAESADRLGRSTPGGEIPVAAIKSTLSAAAAVMDSLNQATRQFAQLSEAAMKTAAEQMVRNTGKK
ncbi:MAG: phasin family protein [Burkholderiales bacterium]|nr:phasin family protein [Burkholderiales bacterium]